MKVTIWGSRGSLASPGMDTARYGGNTACVEVTGRDGTRLVLDAGTGIRRLGGALGSDGDRIDIFLTHLHMDHIQGLGFFGPLRREGVEVHIWGPAGTVETLRERLARYLSPPLFPVRLRDLESRPIFHDLPRETAQVGALRVRSALVCHPGATLGFRVEEDGHALAYLTDHEPAFATRVFPRSGDWTSGYEIARDADLLLHDTQYTDEEYPSHAGWGHSACGHTVAFTRLAGARRLVPFHHDPSHSDDALDAMAASMRDAAAGGFEVLPGIEGTTFEV